MNISLLLFIWSVMCTHCIPISGRSGGLPHSVLVQL